MKPTTPESTPQSQPSTAESLIAWKRTNEAVPRTVCQVLVVDPQRRVLMMHRSNNVRSARNVWSFPSGMHDLGESLVHCGAREVLEEYGLRCDIHRAVHIGTYENIAGDSEPDAEQWHWVIQLMAMRCDDVRLAINREPDKHDELKFISLFDFASPTFFIEHPFHASFTHWATRNLWSIISALMTTSEGMIFNSGCGNIE